MCTSVVRTAFATAVTISRESLLNTLGCVRQLVRTAFATAVNVSRESPLNTQGCVRQ